MSTSPATSSQSQSQSRWFCHACQARFNHPTDPQDPECTNCLSSFVEELEPHFPSDSLPGLWSQSNRSNFIDSLQDDSPPIPSTRQRYEQQQAQRQSPQSNNRHPNPQIPFINFIDPLINILSAPAIPDPPDHHSPSSHSPHSRPQNGPNPPSFSSIGDFFSQHYSPPTFNPSTSFTNRPAGSNENLNNDETRAQADSNSTSSPRPPLQGIYTFAFGSQSSTPTPSDLDPTPDRPINHTTSGEQQRQPGNDRFTNDERFSYGTAGNLPQQPLHGILSLLQSAFGLNSGNNTSNNNTPVETDRRGGASDNFDNTSQQTDETTAREQTSTSSGSGGNESDANEEQLPPDSPRRQSRPTPRSPRVNVEESHPLRQFINILNSLTQSDGSISRNGVNGFVINGGTGFGFTTQFDMDQNSPLGQNLGDYVTSNSAMQDILNQLMNMTGANGAHNPIPASESTIKSLKRFKFDSAMGNEEPIECAICKDVFAIDDGCMELPCKHFFHDEECILPWLKQNGSCPVCRYSLVSNNGQSESEQRTNRDSSNTESDGERSRTRTEDERASMNSNSDNASSSHERSPPDQPQSSQSSIWTDDWEVDQLEPQFDFD